MEILLQKLPWVRWWVVVKDGLRRRYESSMQLLKSITCSSWACRGRARSSEGVLADIAHLGLDAGW